jgi:hypothetical protein
MAHTFKLDLKRTLEVLNFTELLVIELKTIGKNLKSEVHFFYYLKILLHLSQIQIELKLVAANFRSCNLWFRES